MHMPPKEFRIEDVKDVGDVRPSGCIRPSTNSDGAENVLNVPNVPQVHGDPGISSTNPCRPDLKPGAPAKGLHWQGSEIREIAEILGRGYLRLFLREDEKH